jgi:F-type H+-transporting ATPase subunit a
MHYGFSLPLFFGIMVFKYFFFKFHHGEVAEHNGNFTLNHEKIYKQSCWSFNREHGHPTNVRPLDLSNKSVIGILGIAILMLLFAGLAKSYTKNNGIAKSGSFL